MSSRFSCVTLGMERFSLDLPRAVKNREYALEVGCVCVCVCVCVCGMGVIVIAWNL